MGRRNCASCRFYERSSIARMGWCRHPEMYADHHNHLVSSDDLDCDRGSGDFWEPSNPEGASSDTAHSWMTSGPKIISVTSSGSPVFPVSGSSGFNDDPPPPVPGGSGGPSWGNGDRDLSYYEEERYWADYIRIIAPIVGVILLVVLLWFWIANFLGDDNDPDAAAAGTATLDLPTLAVTEAETPAADGSPSAGIPPTATTPGTGIVPTPTAPAVPTTNGTDGPIGVYLGATVEVGNTDGTGVNVRSEASTTSEVLTVFLDGTQIQVIDGPVDAEGFTWWQITGNEVAAGWIVDDYLNVIE